MTRILVVDDERQITRMLRMALQSSGYTVDTAADGTEGLRLFEALRPDLVITDLAMPAMGGLELTRAIRRLATTPIIVLSVRDGDATKVAALDDGADDYLTKPFSMPELQARVRVHLRRSTPALNETVVSVGDITMDSVSHTAKLQGSEIHLTPKEFDLLLLLLRNAGRVMTHKVLLRSVWGQAGESQPEYLRVLIGQLRKKLDNSNKVRYIQSEPWIGYRLLAEGFLDTSA